MTTRSRSAPLSPEVLWYLESRGYEIPDPERAPLIRTPEPRNVKGAVFDPVRVDQKIKALSALRHTKGKWAGTPLKPVAVQVAYFIAPVFGWVAPDSDGNLQRIIRELYIEMPRKGAKTTISSGLAMVLAFADGEPGAEVVMGAAGKDQAKRAFTPLAGLVRDSPNLRRAGIRPLRDEIRQDRTNSNITVTSSVGALTHGANVHAGLVDELHVHRDNSLLEAIESGTGSRSQPLVIIITTADDGQTISPYATRRHMVEQVAEGALKAPSMYAVVFAIPDERPEGMSDEAWADYAFTEKAWEKANPLYPVTPTPEFLQNAADKAKSSATQLASYLRLHLGVRAGHDRQFFNMTRWDGNGSIVDLVKLKDQAAIGGLDLGSVSDLTALVWLFPDGNGGYDVVPRFWTPEAALSSLDARTMGNASGWVKDRYLTLTPGDVTDYAWIQKQVEKDLAAFSVNAIGYDRWNSTQLVIDLEENGAPMVKVSQSVTSLNAAFTELERLVLAGNEHRPLLRHGNNPVLRWMAGNTRAFVDSSGNRKPDKARSMDKIDGISAMTTGLAVHMASDGFVESAYETHGVQTV